MPPPKSIFTIYIEECMKGIWDADDRWRSDKNEVGVTHSLVLAFHNLLHRRAVDFAAQHALGNVTILKLKHSDTYKQRHKCGLFNVIERTLHK